jgi:LEA14-like dessication related protein
MMREIGGRAARAAVSALVLVLAAACGTPAVRQPEVTLEGVQLGGLGLRGGTLLVNVKVYNPNRYALNANELRYDLAISQDAVGSDPDWIDFASGTYDRTFSVAGRDTARVQIPVEFTYSGFGGAAASILRSGTFSYRAIGEVDVRTPVGTYAVPFSRRGTVTMAGVR